MKRRRSLGALERFAGLAARLADPRAIWGDVITLLACWPPDQDPASAVALVEAEVDRWPPHSRTLPRLALEQLRAGEVRPYLRLIRVLDLRALWQNRDRATLLRRMIAAGMHELLTFTTRYDQGEPLIELLVAHITGLRRLQLGGSAIGPAGAIRLARWPELVHLQHLGLPNNHIDDAGAEALLASPHLDNLHSLNLYGNRLSPAMLGRIVAARQWQRTRLVVHGQHLAG